MSIHNKFNELIQLQLFLECYFLLYCIIRILLNTNRIAII